MSYRDPNENDPLFTVCIFAFIIAMVIALSISPAEAQEKGPPPVPSASPEDAADLLLDCITSGAVLVRRANDEVQVIECRVFPVAPMKDSTSTT